MSADDGTQEGDGLTQEMAMEYMDTPMDPDLRARTLDDAQSIYRLGANYRYILDETNPEAAYIMHVRNAEIQKPGDESVPLPVLIRVGTLGRVLDTKLEHFKEKAELANTPLFNRILAEIQAISPAGDPDPASPVPTPSPQIHVGKALAEAPGTPLGQGGKRR